MKKDRRKFINQSIKLGLGLPFAPSVFIAKEEKEIKKSNQSLNILILGGTSFLGPHQVAYAIARGHKVSTFTRGKTIPTIHSEVFEKVESLIGDREDNLEALKGRKWDAVIDNSGRKEKWTKDTAELLKDQVGMYAYTSSVGAYYPYLKKNLSEKDPVLLEIPADAAEHEKPDYDYGVMKARSEQVTREAFGKDRSIIIRPTYMMGPGDRTDRFLHWPIRLKKGGEVIIPGKVSDPAQYIDVRDVAEWMIRLIENKIGGTFNAVGPAAASTVQQFVYGAHAAFGSAASYVQIDDYDFLEKSKIPYMIPWVKPSGPYTGTLRIQTAHSIKNGLKYRPLAYTIGDIDLWWNSNAIDEERRKKVMEDPGSIIVREASIIEAWKNK